MLLYFELRQPELSQKHMINNTQGKVNGKIERVWLPNSAFPCRTDRDRGLLLRNV